MLDNIKPFVTDQELAETLELISNVATDLTDVRKQTSNRLHFECFCSSFGTLLEK